MSLLEALKKFLMYLTITRAMSPRTVEQYGRHIWSFLCFIHPEIYTTVPKAFDITSFFASQASLHPRKKSEASIKDENLLKSENKKI